MRRVSKRMDKDLCGPATQERKGGREVSNGIARYSGDNGVETRRIGLYIYIYIIRDEFICSRGGAFIGW